MTGIRFSRNIEQWRRLALHLRRLLDSTRKAVLEPSQMILHPHAPEQQNDPYDRYRDGTAFDGSLLPDRVEAFEQSS